MPENIKRSKEMISSLLSKSWEVDNALIDKNGKIIIPQPDKLISCLKNIEELFLTVYDIFYGKDIRCIKDQLIRIKIDIEDITESIESAYLMPSREFLVDRLKESMDIIEEQEKEMDDDSKYYKKLMMLIRKRYGEDIADSIYWDADEIE